MHTRQKNWTDHFSILEADTRRWQTRRIQIIQATTIQLIMEEIVLQVTRRLAEETAEEFFYLYKFICDRSDVMFTKTAQVNIM
ncbi:hypothetical protein LSH36_669g01001 [Paralvinella palmiformis]|uniref:Uncharacterized protein n=1 Tax=Paralvinella palmiformis TaxID=53620 RepID=A0AAD9J3Z1_9ANNE|nr:hypothetical protein LSH36_669g01001 [Paralvinella palmiformis]